MRYICVTLACYSNSLRYSGPDCMLKQKSHDEENLSAVTHMNYTRLFHQWVKTRPWSGLKQLPHWWRSVIHTCRNAKISSNVTFFYLKVQPLSSHPVYRQLYFFSMNHSKEMGIDVNIILLHPV